MTVPAHARRARGITALPLPRRPPAVAQSSRKFASASVKFTELSSPRHLHRRGMVTAYGPRSRMTFGSLHEQEDTHDRAVDPPDSRRPRRQARRLYGSRCANPAARRRARRLLVCRQRQRDCLHHLRQVLLDRGDDADQSRQSSDGPGKPVPLHLPRQHLFSGRAATRTEFFAWRRACPVIIGHDVWVGHGAIILPGPLRRHRRGGRGGRCGDQGCRSLRDRRRQPGPGHPAAVLECGRTAPAAAGVVELGSRAIAGGAPRFSRPVDRQAFWKNTS